MLGRPAAPGARAVVVGPDDLVEEALAAEDLVEQQLAVVRLAVVDVEVQRALAREQPVGLLQARRRGTRGSPRSCRGSWTATAARAVAPTPKPVRSPSLSRTARKRPARLHLAGVERRVDVHQLEGLVGERRQQLEVLAEQDLVGHRWLHARAQVRRAYVRVPTPRAQALAPAHEACAGVTRA